MRSSHPLASTAGLLRKKKTFPCTSWYSFRWHQALLVLTNHRKRLQHPHIQQVKSLSECPLASPSRWCESNFCHYGFCKGPATHIKRGLWHFRMNNVCLYRLRGFLNVSKFCQLQAMLQVLIPAPATSLYTQHYVHTRNKGKREKVTNPQVNHSIIKILFHNAIFTSE